MSHPLFPFVQTKQLGWKALTKLKGKECFKREGNLRNEHEERWGIVGTKGQIYQEISIRLQYRFAAHCGVILILQDSCVRIVKAANKQTMVGNNSVTTIEKDILSSHLVPGT